MRVLITGGAGFIGSHLANQLNRAGHYVRVLDDLSSGDPAQLEPGINVNRGDVRDIPKLWALLHGIDVVYHLAARVSLPASILYPKEYNDVNVSGTVSLLEACRDVGVRRVILGSSGTVYGDQEIQPVTEAVPTRPTVPYAVSKVASEQYLFNIGFLSGFETVALRIFNAYGLGQQLPPVHAPAIPQFLQQIIGGGSLIVHGDGQQIRDFVYIDDVVDALVAAMAAPDVDREVINIGSGKGTSVNELIAIMEQVVGKRANVLYNTESTSGVAKLVADIGKANRLLGYQPHTQLAEGIRQILNLDPNFNSARQKPLEPMHV